MTHRRRGSWFISNRRVGSLAILFEGRIPTTNYQAYAYLYVSVLVRTFYGSLPSRTRATVHKQHSVTVSKCFFFKYRSVQYRYIIISVQWIIAAIKNSLTPIDTFLLVRPVKNCQRVHLWIQFRNCSGSSRARDAIQNSRITPLGRITPARNRETQLQGEGTSTVRETGAGRTHARGCKAHRTQEGALLATTKMLASAKQTQRLVPRVSPAALESLHQLLGASVP